MTSRTFEQMSSEEEERDLVQRGIDHLLAEISLTNDGKLEGELWRHVRAMQSGIEIDGESSPVQSEPKVTETLNTHVSIGAIVTTEAEHPEGAIISVLQPAWDTIAKLLAHDPDALRQLSSRQWEELVAASYERAGYDKVILTPSSADHGRDVIAEKYGWGSVRIIDQVKAFSPHRLVKADDVRALLGVLSGDPKATKAIMTTTSAFAPRIATDPYISPFIPYRLELVDGVQLMRRFRSLTMLHPER